MTQKWNLQDIRPIEPRTSRRSVETINNLSPKQRNLKNASADQGNSDLEILGNVAIIDGAKKKSLAIINCHFYFYHCSGNRIWN